MAFVSGYSPAHGYQQGWSAKYGPGGFAAKWSANRAGYAQNKLAKAQAEYQLRNLGKAGKGAAAGMSQLIQNYNQAFQQAREANEARWQQMLQITRQTTGQREADIRASGAQREADVASQFARVGLGGGTMVSALQRGEAAETQANLNRLADQMQGTTLGIMERKVDAYPDPGMITSLFQSLGQGLAASDPSGVGFSRLVGSLGGMQFG